jgi:hypothetical protein
MQGRSSLAAPEARELVGEIKRSFLKLGVEVERYLKPPGRDELALDKVDRKHRGEHEDEQVSRD